MDQNKKIIVISLAGAGDTLMASPLLRELRCAFSSAVIDVLTMQGAVARDILRGNPCVSEHLHHDFMHAPFHKSLGFCLSLRRRRYDMSFTVMPQNRFEYNFVTFLIGARQRFGFDFATKCGAMSRFLLTDCVSEDTQAHLVENNLNLLAEGLGISLRDAHRDLELHLRQEDKAFAERFFGVHSLKDKKLIGFHPGSGTTKNLALRRWAPDKWAELAGMLVEDSEVRVLLFGSPDEKTLLERIIGDSGKPDSVIPVDSGGILQSAAVIERLTCFVCCDTLLTHVAAALKTPSVVIMGPTPHTSVYPWNCQHEIVRTGLDCSPCYGYSRFGIKCVNPEFLKCLKGITPLGVSESIAELNGQISYTNSVEDV